MLSIPVPLCRGLGSPPEVIRGDLYEGDRGHSLAEGGQQSLDRAAHEHALAASGFHD